MGIEDHIVHVAEIRRWFDARPGHQMSVKVHTGSNTTHVATGPFLRLEEHPESPGVFRALFDDSLVTGSGPDATKYITFGFELQGVDARLDALVLDKGAQSIEIVDNAAFAQAPAGSDQVVWPEQVPSAPPSIPAAPPPAAAVGPGPQPAATAPGATEFLVKAGAYDNSMGSRFTGDVTMRVERGWVTITGRRLQSALPGVLMVCGAILLVFGVPMLVVGQMTYGSPYAGDRPISIAILLAGAFVFLAGLASHTAGRVLARSGVVETVQFPLGEARGLAVRYDTNLGCLLSLVLSPIVGLIVMLVRGRRKITIKAPIGPQGKRQTLFLVARDVGDGAVIQRLLRG